MRIENTGGANSFKARYFVTGKLGKQESDILQMVNSAKREATEVWDAVENHCNSIKVPFFVDSCDIKPHMGRKVHEDVISFSFLTGKDAMDYKINPHSERFLPAGKVNKDKNLFLDASEVLKAIKDNAFDFINGVIHNHSVQEHSVDLLS